MARKPSTVAHLAKALNAQPQPIYVLDDEAALVFLNRACREWLGHDADGLLGTTAAYHSEPEPAGPKAVAAELCPPPQALHGQPCSGRVSHVTPDGRVRRRRAVFVPVGTPGGEPLLIVAILDAEDLPEHATPEPAAAEVAPLAGERETEAAELHERIRRFRHEAAGRFRADRLLGDSPAMRRARRQVELAAGSRASVLLVGPPGSGREHTAAAVHYASDPDHVGSLVPLDCSALEADLVRETVRALASGEPLGDRSARSTLLLNHVDRLPAEGQGELAGVLLARSFPLRLMATAERPLAELAREGSIRADLAAGLSTITIELPPLAERREDVPLLAQLFLEEANARSAGQVAGFTPEALDRLDAYLWPGNLDELAQVVAEAHRHAEGPEIEADDFPRRLQLAARATARPARAEETIVLDEFLGRVERELVRRALERAKGNKARAARLLGMTRPRLYRRLEQLGLLDDDGG